jgi:hypothetical protein
MQRSPRGVEIFSELDVAQRVRARLARRSPTCASRWGLKSSRQRGPPALPPVLATASHRARARNCTCPTTRPPRRFCQNFRSGSRCGITHCARCGSKCNFEHKCTPHSRRSRTTSVLIHLEQFIMIIISKVPGSSNTRKRHFTFVQSSAAPCLLLAAVLLSAPSTHPVRVQ